MFPFASLVKQAFGLCRSWILQTETSSKSRELRNERQFLGYRRWRSSISVKQFFRLNLKELGSFASIRAR